MNLLLGILEDVLKLTADEKARLEPVLPYAQDMIDTINAAWSDIISLNSSITATQSLRNTIVSDLTVLVPNAAALLDGGIVDIGGTLAAVRELQGVFLSNPLTMSHLSKLWNRLIPIIDKLMADWPKVAPGYAIIAAACDRQGLTLVLLLGNLQNALRNRLHRTKS